MKKTINLFALVLLAVMLTTTGCKKENTTDNVDLMEGAVEYTGTYPEPVAVTYSDNGVTVTVDAIPGQFLAYFKQSVNDADAEQLINSSGGTVLGKIPVIKFYHVEVDVNAVNQFVSSMQSSGKVFAVKPNIISYPKAGAVIFDACNDAHGNMVRAALQNCAGTYEKCVNVPTTSLLGVPTSMSVNAITAEVNANNGGTTLINMSYNAGLRDEDWDLANNTKAIKAREDWISNMYCLLNGIANMPAKKRENLVLTISAGNENMPVGDLLQALRGKYADNGTPLQNILRDNLLIVTTDSLLVSGIKANYAELSDPDVVIINQPISSQGSSFAAPCAMGYMQSVMQQKGVSAAEALKAMKDASWMTPNREVKLGNVYSLFDNERFVSGACLLVDTGYQLSTMVKHTMNINSVEVLWRPASGTTNGQTFGFAYLTVKAVMEQDCLANCAPPTHVEFNVVMQQDSADCMGNGISGIASAPVSGSSAMIGFIGTRSGNSISGYLYLPNIPYADRNRVNITLQKI